jgi:response regulator RpfG family c-di-GMP phosphodiesterase
MKTLLIIDDSQAEQFLYTQILNAAYPELKVISASNGQKALNLLASESTHPSGILLDLNMPIMNGEEFLEAYSKLYTNNQSKVFLMISYGAEVKFNKAIKHPYVTDIFKRPLDETAIKSIAQELDI